jgi:hypothetical protein
LKMLFVLTNKSIPATYYYIVPPLSIVIRTTTPIQIDSMERPHGGSVKRTGLPQEMKATNLS